MHIEGEPPDDPPADQDDFDLSRDAIAVAVAEGVLLERYGVPIEVATHLLVASAAAAGYKVADAARWLLNTDRLPWAPPSPL
jgi:hypothetical protein